MMYFTLSVLYLIANESGLAVGLTPNLQKSKVNLYLAMHDQYMCYCTSETPFTVIYYFRIIPLRHSYVCIQNEPITCISFNSEKYLQNKTVAS